MKRDKIIKLLISLLLCIVSVRIYYPGSYNNDTWAQYIHMTIHWYDDWFGPGMVWLWGKLMAITGKYVSLYLLLMVSYWLFITILSWNCAVNTKRYWCVQLAAIFLCFIPQYLMRDSVMSLSWGFAALIMLHPAFSKYKAVKIVLVLIVLLLGFYGLLLRPNALVALVPFAMALMFAINKRLGIFRSLLFATGLGVLFFITYDIVLYKKFKASHQYPGYKLKLLDVSGISKLSGHNYLPSCIIPYPSPAYDYLIKNYTPASLDEIYWSDAKPFPQPDSSLYACLDKSWKQAVTDHPLLYIKNRCEGFLYYLRIKKRFTNAEYWNVYIDIYQSNPLGLTMQPNNIRDGFKDIYAGLGKMYLFDPWLWLLVNIALFVFAIYRYRKSGINYYRILACIQLSAIFYMLSQIPIYQFDRDFRYSYWNAFAIIIAMGCMGKGRGAEKQIH